MSARQMADARRKLVMLALSALAQGIEKGVAMDGQRFFTVGILFILLSLVVANVGQFGNVVRRVRRKGHRRRGRQRKMWSSRTNSSEMIWGKCMTSWILTRIASPLERW